MKCKVRGCKKDTGSKHKPLCFKHYKESLENRMEGIPEECKKCKYNEHGLCHNGKCELWKTNKKTNKSMLHAGGEQ